MSNLKEIKGRINSVGSTLKITSAMKMVSSAKLHHTQQLTTNLLPYESSVQAIVMKVLRKSDMDVFFQKPIVDESEELEEKRERIALVALSSNSSLCGAFNANVIKAARTKLADLREQGYASEDIDVYAVGRKISDALKKSGISLTGNWLHCSDKPDYECATVLSDTLVDSYAQGKVSKVILIYNHFVSTSTQRVIEETYLPFELEQEAEEVSGETQEFIMEPGREEIAQELIPKLLRLKIYTMLLDANTAEHAARVVAMQVASDNAKKLLDELSLEYNKRRQQAITNELLDIVGGTMA